MKLKFFFYILVLLLFSVWLLLFALLNEKGGWLFIFTETLVIGTIFFLFIFYRKVIKPLESIGNGMELLREQDFSSRLKPVGQIEADRIIQIFNRMMDQLKDERLRLREQNHFMDLVISASPMGVVILTFDGAVSMINNAALRFMGYDRDHALSGCLLKELDSELAKEIERIPLNSTETIRLNDGMIYRCSRLSFIDRGFAHPFILIESLTDEVYKAEKKAYEKVIRMIAHEVNNTVAGITSTLQTITDVLEEDEENQEFVEVMRICVERSFSMSRFITNFADVVKIPEPETEPVFLNERVILTKTFMETLCLNHDIRLHLDLCESDPRVMIDIILFEQVLLNILKNAIESIGHTGEIHIRTFNNPVRLEIADTGKGIGKEVESRLFTPFFSTKPNGQGIGLIFIREVLMKHGCSFSLRTYPDNKTRFCITFQKMINA